MRKLSGVFAVAAMLAIMGKESLAAEMNLTQREQAVSIAERQLAEQQADLQAMQRQLLDQMNRLEQNSTAQRRALEQQQAELAQKEAELNAQKLYLDSREAAKTETVETYVIERRPPPVTIIERPAPVVVTERYYVSEPPRKNNFSLSLGFLFGGNGGPRHYGPPPHRGPPPHHHRR